MVRCSGGGLQRRRAAAEAGTVRTETAENEEWSFRVELKSCIVVAPYATWYIHSQSNVSIVSCVAEGHPRPACFHCTAHVPVDPWIYNNSNPCSESGHARMLGVSVVSFLNLFMLSWSFESNSSPDVMAFCEVSTIPPGSTGCRACAKHQRPA
jgi:hypothetical protein